MAEQQFPQYRPVRRQQVGLNLPGASVTPAASPVDTYFRTNLPEPSKSNEMLELAGALAPFSKSLGNYLQFEMQNQQEEAKIQAEMDVKEWSAEQVKDFLEMSQEELKASGLLSGPVANRPDYYIAAKINAGKRLGDIAQQDIITKHGEMLADLTDPSKEINIAEALGGIRQEVLGEFGELGFYSQKGAAASIEPLIDSLTKKTIAARQQRVEEENIENLTVGFVKAYTAVAADEIATPGEIQMLMGITQAQLEKYKAVGGKKPQDILFDALERAAGELVEDGSESVAVALMEMARTTLGPGGKPLAKPGTKAHERLLELEDKIEKKIEKSADDAYLERERAQAEASQRVSAVRIRYASGQIDRAEAEESIRSEMEPWFNNHEVEAALIELDEQFKSKNREGNPEEFDRLSALGRKRRLTSDMIESADLSGPEKQQLHDKFIAGKPEDVRAREEHRGQQLLNADLFEIGMADDTAYPPAVRAKLRRSVVQFEDTFWSQYDPDDPDFASKRAQAVREFKQTHADDLNSRKDQQRRSQDALLRDTYNTLNTAIGQELDLEGTAISDILTSNHTRVRRAWRDELDVAIGLANDAGLEGEAFNEYVKDHMDDNLTKVAQGIARELRETESVRQRTESVPFQQVTQRQDLDTVGEDTLLGGGWIMGRRDPVDVQEGLQDMVSVLRRTDLTAEEFASKLSEAREDAKVGTDEQRRGWQAALQRISAGGSVDDAVAAYEAEVPGQDSWLTRNFMATLTPDQAKKIHREFLMVEGLDAASLAEGNVPEGLTANEIDLGLMPLT